MTNEPIMARPEYKLQTPSAPQEHFVSHVSPKWYDLLRSLSNANESLARFSLHWLRTHSWSSTNNQNGKLLPMTPCGTKDAVHFVRKRHLVGEEKTYGKAGKLLASFHHFWTQKYQKFKKKMTQCCPNVGFKVKGFRINDCLLVTDVQMFANFEGIQPVAKDMKRISWGEINTHPERKGIFVNLESDVCFSSGFFSSGTRKPPSSGSPSRWAHVLLPPLRARSTPSHPPDDRSLLFFCSH